MVVKIYKHIAYGMNIFMENTRNENPQQTLHDTMASEIAIPELPDVSERNTKSDIWNAYRTLVKKVQDNVRNKKGDQSRKGKEDMVVQRATEEYTVDITLRRLEDVKMDMAQTLNVLSQKLTGEAKKLTEITDAIAIQNNRLNDLHDIEIATLSLEDLIKAQEAKKEEFAAEYEKILTERKRNEEEYAYNRNQQTKKEEALRNEREEAYKKRDEELKQKESEFAELRKKVDGFPRELEEKILKTRNETAERITKEMASEAALKAKEIEGEKNVLTTRIQFLVETNTQKNSEIMTLKKELDQATRQVQSIAEKAIEGSSGKQTLKAVSDIALKQAGHSSREE
jgi:DNA repair exonuclease SbcCD ATPase subunit